MPERILIIDDEEDIRTNLKDYFSDLKYNVFLAEDGKSAQKILLERMIDIVLLDLMLPDMDGIDLLEWIKNNPKTYNVPVIILSAKSNNTTKVIGLSKGADDFIAKPYNLMEVTARIRNIISRSKEKYILNPLIHSLSDWYSESGVMNLKEQLEISSQIQKTLLPRKFPDIEGYDLSARIKPSQFIGGDFYDFFEITPTKHIILLGDVTGRGIPAAIMMVITRSFLRLSKIWYSLPPLEVIKRLNNLLVQDIPSDSFVTLYYIVLDKEEKTLSFVSTGGLTQPYHYSKKNNEGDYLNVYGAIVGMFDDQEMEINSFDIGEGDVFVFFTDGIVSTLNSEGKVYSPADLRKCMEKNIHLSARELCQVAIDDVVKFAGKKTDFEDDMAILVIKSIPGSDAAENK